MSDRIVFLSHCVDPTMIRIPGSIDDIVAGLLKAANTKLPDDIGWALEAAAGWETDETARSQLGGIMENVRKAQFLARPMCQDTGVPVFYVSGKITAGIEEGIREGIRKANSSVPLRPNTVHPMTRKNSGDNLGKGMPIIHYKPSDADNTDITVLIKGAGSENMTRLAMLNPSDGVEGIKAFVISAVLEAGGRPCPPTVVGIGIGGTSDRCVEMAKEALLIPLDKVNEDETERKLEEELFTTLNSSGLGPMGLGGDSTVLGVRIVTEYCHTASLPVAVNLNCWAARKATVRIMSDGTYEYGKG